MTREKTEGPAVYEAGTLAPTFLPNPTSKNPAEAEPVTATTAERRDDVAALEAERAAWAERHGRLRDDLSRAHAEAARIRAQLAAAESRERDAALAIASAKADHEAVVIPLECKLRKTAAPLIDKVQLWLRDQLDALRRRGVMQTAERFGPRNVLTLRRPRTVFSNAESIEQRRLAIQAALVTWEGYRLAAIEPEELQARSEALPASLPAADGSIEAPIEPMLTNAETRELAWRLGEEGR